ncbi:MAG: membrane dipeptidase [Chloroflexi bacterium]|nr:membrane dipeptidase [Chloroflexota bacterium]
MLNPHCDQRHVSGTFAKQRKRCYVTATIRVFDGHNDTLLRLYRPEAGDSFFGSPHGHIDLPRARAGGLAGGFFAVFVPTPPDAPEYADDELPAPLPLAYAQQTALSMVALLFRIEAQAEGQVRVARTVEDLTTGLQQGVLTAILHFEGADPIDTNLDALEVLYQAGLRSLGIVWSRPNAFGNGVPFRFPHGPDTGAGLTDAGRHLVRACNRLGILLDLSHLNEAGFWDVARLSTAPLVATHSNAHAICPSPRNLTDRQLDAIRESDGMVGVNLHVGFLRPDGGRDARIPLDLVVDHFVYLVERLGIERVGLGSDFDGALMPADVGDATGLPRLFAALRRRGFDEPSLHKLAHENWLRVLKKTWK